MPPPPESSARLAAEAHALRAELARVEERIAATEWIQRETLAELRRAEADRDRVWHESRAAITELEYRNAQLMAKNEELRHSLRAQAGLLIHTSLRAVRARVRG